MHSLYALRYFSGSDQSDQLRRRGITIDGGGMARMSIGSNIFGVYVAETVFRRNYRSEFVYHGLHKHHVQRVHHATVWATHDGL